VITWVIREGADLVKCAYVPVAFGTAHDCLFEFGHLKSGETVLVQAGAGGVGVAAVQLAKRAGATVISTASSLDRLAPLKALGLDHAVDYSQSGWVDVVRDLTGGRGVDLVVDPVGSTLAGSVQALAYRGRVTLVGNAGRDPQPLDASMLMMGNQTLTGVFLGAEITTDRVRANVARHLEDIAAGHLRDVVDRTFPLSDAAGAHAYAESRQAFGRVVLIP